MNNGRPPQRRRISPEERRRREEELRRRREYEKAREKRRRKARRKERMRVFLGRLIVFGVVLIIVLLIFGLIFFMFFRSTPDKASDSGKMAYYYGGKRHARQRFRRLYRIPLYTSASTTLRTISASTKAVPLRR